MSKRPITPTYTFVPSAGTLNLSGIASFDIRNLFAVINLKTGALLYAPLAGFGYSALSGTTLTLVVATAAMGATDPLMIVYDDGGKPAEDASLQTLIQGAAAGQTNDATALAAINANATAQAQLHTDLTTTQPRAIAAMPVAKKATGSLSAVNDAVTLACDGFNTASLQLGALSGTPTGAAVIEATQDGGTTWFPVNMAFVTAGTTAAPTSALAPGAQQNLEASVGSYDQIRARCTIVFSAPQPVVLGAYYGVKSLRTGLLPGSKAGMQIGGQDVAAANPVPVQPFAALKTQTIGLTAGATATGSNGLLIPTTWLGATAIRVRNPVASTSPVTFKLAAAADMPPAIPAPYDTTGAGGSLGDKTLDPGVVEVFQLTANQQTLLAAGTLRLSVIVPSGGAGALFLTPGSGV